MCDAHDIRPLDSVKFAFQFKRILALSIARGCDQIGLRSDVLQIFANVYKLMRSRENTQIVIFPQKNFSNWKTINLFIFYQLLKSRNFHPFFCKYLI